MELIVGNVYEANRRAPIGSLFEEPLINDRQIIWMDSFGLRVQYDGPTVKIGQKRPIVTREAFLKWAKRDITSEMPEGEWRKAK